MRSTHRILISAVAVSLVLLTSACGASGGNSDGGKDDATTTTKAEAEETTTTEADEEADAQARADSVEFDIADFPDGWDSAPGTDPDEESPLSECDPALGDRSVQLARHASDEFTIGSFDDGTGVQVTARAVVFEDEAAAEAAMAPLSDPDVVACIDEQLKSAYSSGGTDITVEGELTEADVDFDVDETMALGATYTVSAASDGSTQDVDFGILVLRTGDVAINVLIQSVDPEFDASALPFDQLVEQLNAA